MILILCAVMRLFMLSDSGLLASQPPTRDPSATAFTDELRRVFPSATDLQTSDWLGDDETPIGEIREPRGLEDTYLRYRFQYSLPATWRTNGDNIGRTSPSDLFKTDPGANWSVPDRRAQLETRLAKLRADAADEARHLGSPSIVYPMRTYFCDKAGVLEERVVDWTSPYSPK